MLSQKIPDSLTGIRQTQTVICISPFFIISFYIETKAHSERNVIHICRTESYSKKQNTLLILTASWKCTTLKKPKKTTYYMYKLSDVYHLYLFI